MCLLENPALFLPLVSRYTPVNKQDNRCISNTKLLIRLELSITNVVYLSRLQPAQLLLDGVLEALVEDRVEDGVGHARPQAPEQGQRVANHGVRVAVGEDLPETKTVF